MVFKDKDSVDVTESEGVMVGGWGPGGGGVMAVLF